MNGHTQKTRKPGLIFQAAQLDLGGLPRIDSHLHTSWTDGKGSVEEVYRAAVESGLSAVLYSEHSRKTSTDWFPAFAAEVRALPVSPCVAYVGTEVKVESRNGSIDTTSAISDLCDFVMASVHRFIDADERTLPFEETDPGKAVDLEFELSWAVLENPRVDILGHMFGMSYRRFGKVPPDDMMRALISRAAEYEVAIEVNSHYHPRPWQIIEWCREYGALITFGSNAHALGEVGAIMQLLDRKTGNA